MKRVPKTIKYNDLHGKTVAITGSTGGLGNAVCRHLAEMGADLILIDRNRERSEAFGSELTKLYPNLKIEYVTADMSDLSSVKKAADFLNENVPDIFIANAGTYRIRRTKTADGFDSLFQINCVAPYFLIKSIIPAMRKKKGRVVAVSSISQLLCKIDENDIEGKEIRNAEKAYANSKRVLTVALFEAFKNEIEVQLSVVHPGICHTNLMSNYPKVISKLIKIPMKIIFMSPQKASLSIIIGIFTNCCSYEWIGPSILGIWGAPKKSKIKEPTEEEMAIVRNI